MLSNSIRNIIQSKTNTITVIVLWVSICAINLVTNVSWYIYKKNYLAVSTKKTSLEMFSSMTLSPSAGWYPHEQRWGARWPVSVCVFLCVPSLIRCQNKCLFSTVFFIFSISMTTCPCFIFEKTLMMNQDVFTVNLTESLPATI